MDLTLGDYFKREEMFRSPKPVKPVPPTSEFNQMDIDVLTYVKAVQQVGLQQERQQLPPGEYSIEQPMSPKSNGGILKYIWGSSSNQVSYEQQMQMSARHSIPKVDPNEHQRLVDSHRGLQEEIKRREERERVLLKQLEEFQNCVVKKDEIVNFLEKQKREFLGKLREQEEELIQNKIAIEDKDKRITGLQNLVGNSAGTSTLLKYQNLAESTGDVNSNASKCWKIFSDSAKQNELDISSFLQGSHGIEEELAHDRYFVKFYFRGKLVESAWEVCQRYCDGSESPGVKEVRAMISRSDVPRDVVLNYALLATVDVCHEIKLNSLESFSFLVSRSAPDSITKVLDPFASSVLKLFWTSVLLDAKAVFSKGEAVNEAIHDAEETLFDRKSTILITVMPSFWTKDHLHIKERVVTD